MARSVYTAFTVSFLPRCRNQVAVSLMSTSIITSLDLEVLQGRTAIVLYTEVYKVSIMSRRGGVDRQWVFPKTQYLSKKARFRLAGAPLVSKIRLIELLSPVQLLHAIATLLHRSAPKRCMKIAAFPVCWGNKYLSISFSLPRIFSYLSFDKLPLLLVANCSRDS